MTLRIRGLDTAFVEGIRAGGPDAHGQPAVVRRAEGLENPCRHCLGLIAEGDDKLVLAYRPFDVPQPYAEVGPIFLHADACARYDAEDVPGWFAFLEPALVRGYGADDWIRYDVSGAVPGPELAARCRAILLDPTVARAHVHSKYGCFQARVERAA